MRKSTPTTGLFAAICERRRFINCEDTKDCGVVALSVVASLSYDDSRTLLFRHGYRPDRGVYRHMMIEALKELDLNPVNMSSEEFVKLRYPRAKQSKTFVTPRQVIRFPQAWSGLPPCLLWTCGHVLAVKDGEVHDWSAGRSLKADLVTFVLGRNQTLVA